MRVTIYLPDELAEAVQAYLEDHPGSSLSSLVQEALRAHLTRRPEVLLELAGLVPEARFPARAWAEDRVQREDP